MEQKAHEVPSYLNEDEQVNQLRIAPITGNEESLCGYNAFVQTDSTDNDENIAFAGVNGLSNNDILFSVDAAPIVKNHKKVDTA